MKKVHRTCLVPIWICIMNKQRYATFHPFLYYTIKYNNWNETPKIVQIVENIKYIRFQVFDFVAWRYGTSKSRISFSLLLSMAFWLWSKIPLPYPSPKWLDFDCHPNSYHIIQENTIASLNIPQREVFPLALTISVTQSLIFWSEI